MALRGVNPYPNWANALGTWADMLSSFSHWGYIAQPQILPTGNTLSFSGLVASGKLQLGREAKHLGGPIRYQPSLMEFTGWEFFPPILP